MTSAILPELPFGGFSFENFHRNEYLAVKGYPMPKARKTGTTIAGIVFKDGVILGGDTRATEDTIVADITARRSTTWLKTSIAAAPELLPTRR